MTDVRATSSAVELTASLRTTEVSSRELLADVAGGYDMPPGFE